MPSAIRPKTLRLSIGQYSSPGRKPVNQDFHGARIPPAPLLHSKGIAVALADGISSSAVSQIASQAAVGGFLEDYFCTPEAWSVKTAAQRVLIATNSWLHAQTRQSQYRYDQDKGYVCTFSAVIFKSATAHLFHVGDAGVFVLQNQRLEPLTRIHRLHASSQVSYLARALGADQHLEIDYHTLPLSKGMVWLLATDGVHEYLHADTVAEAVHQHRGDLDGAARAIAEHAYQSGSDDNLTVQLVRVDDWPAPDAGERLEHIGQLPPAPLLEARARFDGYTVIRELHASSRSHVYLAKDDHNSAVVALKVPSLDLRDDPRYLERLLMEEWVARRINSPHVLKAPPAARPRQAIYTVMDFIDGQTLQQWMIDHPTPDLATVRGLIGQIANGLRAFHRLEMLHQDLRPANIMIDATGTVTLIDFGSTRVAGLVEADPARHHDALLGTAQYTAPEYFLGQPGSARSDLFSLGVITYQLLTGALPYGAQVAKCTTRAAQNRLRYGTGLRDRQDVPAWVNEAVKRAVQPDPNKRYPALSEFLFDLHHPRREFLARGPLPLIERDPVRAWQGIALVLAVTVIILLARLSAAGA
ncbi:bifunctional protein-serine/threonine kinase/phosphatase [Alloalcanivorax mobilis]|uniref:bifunctional protein-serine/threonine kinase/phosphatase n=1 Tax=Alloalcanivorax mobilis TaxID=2019569 RepID=UPI000C7884E1|nr:bifunctional protein-serine/threonine kinase/phosphatase [Alloalcanivorax mobilis]